MASDYPLFRRVWSVTIGPAGGQGKTWRELRVAFKVEKNGDSSPNKGQVTIFNLSRESRAFIKKGMAVRLMAGYEADPRLILTGEIELADHEESGPDWVSTLEVADSVRAYRSAVLAETFGPKTSESTVVNAAAKRLGVTLGTIKGLSDDPFNQGRTLTGPASRELDALCRSRGLRWSIQDGILQILPANLATDEPAIVVSPETGLVGSPKRLEKGLELPMLLQGGINPGRLLKVESREHKGLYVAENVTHQGDSHGRDWYSRIEALPVA